MAAFVPVFADGPDRRHRIARRGLAAVIALRLVTRDLVPLADQPAAQFRPPGLLSWLGAAPPVGVLVALQLVGLVAAVAAAVGLGVAERPAASFLPEPVRDLAARASLLVAWAILLVLSAVATSGGKILHNEVLLLVAALPYALVPENRIGGEGAVPRSPRRNVGWPQGVAVVVIALAYAMAGVAKLIHTGPSWVLSENMRYVMYWSAQSERPALPAFTELLARNGALAQLTAASILAVELAFPLVLVWRRARPWFALAAVGLHVGTWLTLGLDYWGWGATAALVLVDWDEVPTPSWITRRSAAARGDAGRAGIGAES